MTVFDEAALWLDRALELVRRAIRATRTIAA